nr:hypothetical protein Iba_chr01fCG3080 [Ipomoea batatas]
MPVIASIVAVYTDSSGPTLVTVLVTVLGSPSLSLEMAIDGYVPVVITADLIAEALKFGLCALTAATIPDVWGAAMEVPELVRNWGGFFPGIAMSSIGDHAARMSTPVLSDYLDDCFVAQDDLRLEIAVDGGGGDGENPGSFVVDTTAFGAIVTGDGDNNDASLHRMKRAESNSVGAEIRSD